jgi:hypothetical protein
MEQRIRYFFFGFTWLLNPSFPSIFLPCFSAHNVEQSSLFNFTPSISRKFSDFWAAFFPRATLPPMLTLHPPETRGICNEQELDILNKWVNEGTDKDKRAHSLAAARAVVALLQRDVFVPWLQGFSPFQKILI